MKKYNGKAAFFRQLKLSDYPIKDNPIVIALGFDSENEDGQISRRFNHFSLDLKKKDDQDFISKLFDKPNNNCHYYYVPNYSRGKTESTNGASTLDIIGTRLLFVEFDSIPFFDQFKTIKEFGIEPNYYVMTKKSLHCYWVLNETITDMKLWTYYIEQLIEKIPNSDPVIKNPSRLMRIAGANYPNHGECLLLEGSNPELKRSLSEFEFNSDYPQPEIVKNQISYEGEIKFGVDTPLSDLTQQLAENIEDLFNWEGHNFINAGNGKYKGCCPFHDSKSGTSFWVEQNDNGVWSWACPTCTDNQKKNLLFYRSKLLGKDEQPKGLDLVRIEEQIKEDVLGIQKDSVMTSSVLESTEINTSVIINDLVLELKHSNTNCFKLHVDFVEYINTNRPELLNQLGNYIYSIEFFNEVKRAFYKQVEDSVHKKSNDDKKFLLSHVDINKLKEVNELNSEKEEVFYNSQYKNSYILKSIVEFYIRSLKRLNVSDPYKDTNIDLFRYSIVDFYYESIKQGDTNLFTLLGEDFTIDFAKSLNTNNGINIFKNKIEEYEKELDESIELTNIFDLKVLNENIKVNPLFPTLIPDGNTILLASDPGVGKSLLVADLCLAVIQPETKRFLDTKCTVDDGSVLYVNTDESLQTVADRMISLGIDKNLTSMNNPNARFFYDQSITNLETQVYDIEDKIKQIKKRGQNLKLIIVDSLTSTMQDSDIDENHPKIAKPMVKLTRLANEYNLAIVVLHHTNKSGGISGSNRLSSACHTVYVLNRVNKIQDGEIDNDPNRELICTKNRTGITFRKNIEINPKHRWDIDGAYDLNFSQKNLDGMYREIIEGTFLSNLTKEDYKERTEFISFSNIQDHNSSANLQDIEMMLEKMKGDNKIEFNPSMFKFAMIGDFRNQIIKQAEKINGEKFTEEKIGFKKNGFVETYKETHDLINKEIKTLETLAKEIKNDNDSQIVHIPTEIALEPSVILEPIDSLSSTLESLIDNPDEGKETIELDPTDMYELLGMNENDNHFQSTLTEYPLKALEPTESSIPTLETLKSVETQFTPISNDPQPSKDISYLNDDEKSSKFLNYLINDNSKLITLREWSNNNLYLSFEDLNKRYLECLESSEDWVTLTNEYDVYYQAQPEFLKNDFIVKRVKEFLLKLLHDFNIDVILNKLESCESHFVEYINNLLNDVLETEKIFDEYEDSNEIEDFVEST